MAKKGFDLAALARESMGGLVTKMDTVETVEAIPRDRIDANAANFYEMSDLEELASSIELAGLLHPVIVKPAEGGRYVILDGERRFRALGILGRETVPAIVRQPLNDVFEELMLIEANRTQRRMTAGELSRQAERYTQLLASLRDAGVEIPGRLRDRVAEAMQVSASKLGRLQAIREHASPSVLAAFDAGELRESVAYELQRLDPDVQDKILYAEVGDAVEPRDLTAEGVVRAAAQLQRKAPERCAPAAHETFDARAEVSDYLERRQSEDDDFFLLLTEVADGYLRALNGVNSRAEGIETLKRRFRTSGHWSTELESDGSSRGLALSSPDRKIKPISRTWTEVYDLLCTIALSRAATAPAPAPEPVPKSDTAPAGLVWHKIDFDHKPLFDFRRPVLLWGPGGLKNVPQSLIYDTIRIMPETVTHWACIDGPEDEAAESEVDA